MNYSEYVDLKESLDDLHPEEFVVSDFHGSCEINGRIAFRLKSVEPKYALEAEIQVEENGNLLGFLCLCKGYALNLSSITEVKFACYLAEITPDLYGQPYVFQYDYFVVEISQFDHYAGKYAQGSPIWGGFLHDDNSVLSVQPYKSPSTEIVARENILLPTQFHKDNVIRALAQPYGFERFLKLYHLLELHFDASIVEDIKNLREDLQGIGQILSSYRSQEYDRLKSFISKKCSGAVQNLENELNRLANNPTYRPKAETIFFNYSKDYNPYKDKKSKFDNMMNYGGFNFANAKKAKIVDNQADYDKLLISTTTYWIYRTRSSIAHHRIGEYLMRNEDEQFVVEVVEPLLREVLCLTFSA